MQSKTGYLKTADGVFIACHNYRNNHKKSVIIAHGFYNSKEAVLLQKLKDRLLKKYDVFMFDFRGHGESSGAFTLTSKESLDLNAVLDYLKDNYLKIGLIGFSLGGSIAINVLSKRRDVNSLICVSSPSDVSKVDYKIFEADAEKDILYALLMKEGKIGKGVKPGAFWLEKIRPIDVVSKVRSPILYITGDKDWLVKPWHSQKLYDKTRSKKKLVIIKTGSHAEYLLRAYFVKVAASIENWFKTTLRG